MRTTSPDPYQPVAPAAPVTATLDGLDLVVTAADALPLLVLGVDVATGEGGYLQVDVRPGVTRLAAPLHRSGVHVEVVDGRSGAVYAQLVTAA
ncbi:hypothetical protein RDV89_10685 [Nocardioides zeae]|uniref:Uncharacterized protein n=1 Tax=Nocardioides imazamoxiresistens TaxID=3231893 RepID=A0ABU3PWJ7_9ACTN|nr:hypothetical protein [Nocardioides zeae]MDT9593534.1 hypothetical protein [Nocardioides zeae]